MIRQLYINSTHENNMNFQPLSDRIVVSPEAVQVETKTAGGLYIPDTAQESSGKPIEGTVVAVGPYAPMQLKVDTRVLFQQYSGTEIKVEGKHYLLLRVDEVLGYFSNKK